MFTDTALVTNDEFRVMLSLGWIIDGRAGGFVIGRSHDDGNINMIMELEDGNYSIFCNLEGGEYIINYLAYEAAKERVDEINSFYDEHDLPSSIVLSDKTRILNTLSLPSDKLILISPGQFIVNKKATAKYYYELEDINYKNNGRLHCNLYCLTVKDIKAE
jgi:hypothetical protein